MNSKYADLYGASAISVIGFIALASLIGYFQANPTALDQKKNEIQMKKEAEKLTIQAKGEIAQSAVREGQVFTDSIQLAGVTKAQPQPPTIPAIHFNTRFRKLVLDQKGQCIGFTQEGNFFSSHRYQGIPNYLYLPNGCEEYEQSKVNDTTNQWTAQPPPLDQVQQPEASTNNQL